MIHPLGKSAVFAVGIVLTALPGAVPAHFQELIPTPDLVTPKTGNTVNLNLIFTHPMEGGPVMEMAAPAQFGVLVNGQKTDLKATLKPRTVDGKTTYETRYKVTEPGDYIFYVEPAPYWEPSEGKHITHYTKVVVDAFGAEEGWDALVGFPVEIEPLVRPYGLWTGNLFRGVVKRDGQPVPFADIEVEYRNEGKTVGIPADPFITQVIRADANGTFSYAMPRAGWWSFAALVDGAPRPGPDGKEAGHELGALIWVKTIDMK
jgi:cobalt/nickel transport protein